MKVGVFGGVFDPVHRGHLDPVRQATEALGLDRVLYVPTASPPHKEAAVAAAARRFAMLELALLDRPECRVEDLELTPGVPTYTVRTLEKLTTLRPGDEHWWILGEDAFTELESWREWESIPRLASLAVLARPGVEASLSPALRALVESGRAVRVEVEPVPLSSSGIRATLASGRLPPAGAVPGPVLNYIRKYGLYR